MSSESGGGLWVFVIKEAVALGVGERCYSTLYNMFKRNTLGARSAALCECVHAVTDAGYEIAVIISISMLNQGAGSRTPTLICHESSTLVQSSRSPSRPEPATSLLLLHIAALLRSL